MPSHTSGHRQRWWATAAWAGAAALTVRLAWQASMQATRAQHQTQASKRLFSFTGVPAIEAITLRGPRATFVLRRRAGGAEPRWVLTSHGDLRADAANVDGLLRAALNLTARRTLVQERDGDGVPARPDAATGATEATYGLDAPRYSLALTGAFAAIGATPVTEVLEVGGTSPFDGSLYVRRAGSGDIALVASAFAYELERDLGALRDKNVAPFDVSTVSGVETTALDQAQQYVLARQGHVFVLTHPAPFAADADQVASLLHSLADLQGQRVAAARAADAPLAAFGLQVPRARLRIARGDARAVHLCLGQVAVGAFHHVYAMTAPDAPIWEVAPDSLTILTPQAASLRDMRVVHVGPPEVFGVTLTRHMPGQATTRWSFRRHKDAPDGPGWRLQAAQGATDAAAQADANMGAQAGAHAPQVEQLGALVAEVAALRAHRIAFDAPTPALLQQCGLQHARLEVDLFGADDALLASLWLGHDTHDGAFVTTDRKDRIDVVGRQACGRLRARCEPQ